MPAGRPLKYKTPEQLQAAIDEYFAPGGGAWWAEKAGEEERYCPTMTGLAMALGMERTTLVAYSHRDEFFHTVKDARQRVQDFLERRLTGNGQVTGAIFNLKNNFGWKDQQEISASHSIKREARELSDDELAVIAAAGSAGVDRQA